ncbi:hypothetical protein ACFLTH_04330 [Bacteroidota bacterium]
MGKECPAWMAWVVLVLGVLFLLKDLGIWTFWDINWWTVVFVLAGLWKVTK